MQLFSSIDRIYRFLATLLDREYFFNRWSDGRLPLFRDEHLLSVQSMTLQSPLGIEGAAAAEVTRSLGDALSLKKQIQDIRTSSLVVADKNLSCGARKWNLRG